MHQLGVEHHIKGNTYRPGNTWSQILKMNVSTNLPKYVIDADTQYLARILDSFEKCPTIDELLEYTHWRSEQYIQLKDLNGRTSLWI